MVKFIIFSLSISLVSLPSGAAQYCSEARAQLKKYYGYVIKHQKRIYTDSNYQRLMRRLKLRIENLNYELEKSTGQNELNCQRLWAKIHDKLVLFEKAPLSAWVQPKFKEAGATPAASPAVEPAATPVGAAPPATPVAPAPLPVSAPPSAAPAASPVAAEPVSAPPSTAPATPAVPAAEPKAAPPSVAPTTPTTPAAEPKGKLLKVRKFQRRQLLKAQ